MILSRLALLHLLAGTASVAAFTAPRIAPSSRTRVLLLASDQDEEPDLFDYFDPLLSPHAYPNGISPDNGKPAQQDNVVFPDPQTMDSIGPTDFINIKSSVEETFIKPSVEEKTSAQKDAVAAASSPNNNVFDPLLSPHMYPNGTPETVLGDEPQETLPSETETMDSISPSDFMSIMSVVEEEEVAAETPKAASSSPDVFDPLLSPHMYPNGTPDTVLGDEPPSSPKKKATEVPKQAETPIAPLETSAFVSLLSSVSASEKGTQQPPVAVDPDYFDPLLSPHMYPNGTPDRFFDDKTLVPKKKKVGVLLMDHGSRNQASNDRLHEVARIYQETDTDAVVTAAHMEIAQPDIPTGLQKLLDAGVDEIVCHPYFLSANGRHVSEDIPAIVEDAKEALGIEDVAIAITAPVGSQTDLMIAAIQSLVKEQTTTTTQ